MSSALDELRGEVARAPADHDLFRRFGAACLESDDFESLLEGAEPVLRAATDPDALRARARALADALVATAPNRAAHDAVELLIRASRLYADIGGDKVAAARAVATAWALAPDERLSAFARRVIGDPPVDEAPRWLLVALSQVGPEGLRVQALRRLAAIALDARQLEEAEGHYRDVSALRHDDADATEGLRIIDTLRATARKGVVEAKRRVDTAGSGDDAVTALTRLGDAELAAGALEAAEGAYRRALAAGPAPRAESALEQLLREQGRELDLVALWRELLTSATRDRQVLLRRRLYQLLHELGRDDEARQYLVVTSAPTTEDAAAIIERALATGRAGDWVGAVQLLEDAVGRTTSKDSKIALLLEEARIHEAELADPAAAERAYKRVRVTDPRDLTALSFYRRWYAEHDDPRRAHANLTQLDAVLADDPALAAERLDVAVEMAQVAETGLKSYDKAIDAWRRVLEADPVSDRARRELVRLYGAAGRWHSLIDHLDAWVKALPDAAVERKVELLFDIIGIYQDPEKLPMEEMVAQTYERIVELAPTETRALDGLASNLSQRERWSDLVAVLAKKVDLTEDPVELLELFHQIAGLYLDQVHSESQALPVLERILEISPGELDVIRRLRDIYRRRADSEKLYVTYQRELELLEGAERLEVLVELAKLATDPLFRPEEAIAWWRQVLALEPRHERAREALQELHAEQADWGGYVALLEERLAEAKTRKARVEVLLELGEILYARLGDEARAQEIFARIAAESPFNTTARHFLQRLYVTRRGWAELRALYAKHSDWRAYAALLQDYADRVSDNVLAADIHVEVARVLEEEEDDTGGALRHLERALEAAPDRVDVARMLLARLPANAKPAQRVPALTTLARHATELGERREAWRDLARARAAAGDARASFEAWCQAVVYDAAAGDVGNLDALEAAAAAENAWEPAYVALQEALGRLSADAIPARIRLHRALGMIATTRLTRHDDAVQHLLWVLQLAPGDEAALDALERIHFSQNDFNGLEQVFSARAAAARTPAERVAPLFRLGQLYEDVLVDSQRAAATYQQILGIAPNNAEALDATARVLEADELYDELAAFYETALTRLDAIDTRDAVQVKLGALYEARLDQPLAAVDHLQDVVEHGGAAVPQAVAALERLFEDPRVRAAVAPVLEGVYREHQDAARLVSMLRARLGASESDLDRIGLLDEIAMLSEGALESPGDAFDALCERLSLAPADKELWRDLERLAGATGAWDKLVAVLSALVAGGASARLPADALASLRIALGDILHTRTFDIEPAIEQIEQAVAESQDDDEILLALERLEVLYKKAADLDGYVRSKLRASERVISRAARRRKILDACQALAGSLGRPEEALTLCRGLFDEDPGEPDVGDMLVDLLERQGAHDEVDAAYERRVAATTDPELIDRLRYRHAIFRRDHLDAWELAIDGFLGLIASPTMGTEARQALLEICRAQESDEQRELVLEALEDYYLEHGETDGQLAVLLVRADAATPGPARAAALRAAAAVCLPDPARAATDPDIAQNAFDLYAQALYEDPADDVALDRMTEIAGATGQWAGLVEACDLCAEKAGLDPAALPLWRHAAVHAEEQLGDVPRAIAAWRRQLDVLAAHPGADVEEALVALDRLYEATGAPDARVEILDLRRRAARDDWPAVVALLAEKARVLLALARDDDATTTLREAWTVASDARGQVPRAAREPVATQLESLLTAAGRHEELVELLLGEASLADDADARLLATYRAAEVATERLATPARAIGIYRDLLAWAPHDEIALGSLVELYAQTGDWAGQADVLEEQLALALDAGATGTARDLHLALGALYAGELSRPMEAVDAYAAVLADEESHAGALEALSAIAAGGTEAASDARWVLAESYRAADRPEALAAILEAAAEADDPHQDATERQVELARLYHERLSAPDRAWAHAAAAYEAEPDSEGFEARRELVLAVGAAPERHEELARFLLGVSSALSEHEARLARRRADVRALVDAHARAELALPLWYAILEDAPADGEALDELELWARAHDDDDMLIDVLRRRVAAEGAAGGHEPYHLELGRLLGKDPNRLEEAAAAFRAVLDHAPAHKEAFSGLVKLEIRRRDWPALAALYQARLDQAEDAAEALALRNRLARLQWQRLGDAAAAVALYQEVLGEVPAEPEAIGGLEALWGEGRERPAIFHSLEAHYETKQDWDRLIALYTSTLESGAAEDDALQEECLFKMARLELVQLDRPEAAFTTMKALVERLDEPGALLDQLEDLAGRTNRWDDVASYYEARVASGRATAQLMARLARIQETKTGDTGRAVHFYRFALEREPGNRVVRDQLRAVLERTGAWEDLVALELASTVGNEDEEDCIALWSHAAEVLATRLGRKMEAVQCLERVLELRPSGPGPHERIVALLEELGEFALLHEHYRGWIELTPTDQDAVALQIRLGRSLARFPPTMAEGVAELEGVLEAEESDASEVVTALFEILAAAEAREASGEGVDTLTADATARAAALLEEHLGDAPLETRARFTTAKLRPLPAGRERRRLLVRLGDQLAAAQEGVRAFSAYAEALRGDVGQDSIERSIEALAAEQGLWEELSALYQRCVDSPRVSEPVALRYQLKIGNILHDHLGRQGEAVTWYEQVLSHSPGNRDALEPLAAWYRAVGDGANEARVLDLAIDAAEDDDEAMPLLRRLGVVRMDQLGDAAGAIDALELTLPGAAADKDVVGRLERLYVGAASYERLVELYRTAIEQTTGDDARAIELLAKLAQVAETRLGDLESARVACRRILERDADHGFALTSLDRVERARGDWAAVDAVLARRVEAASSKDARVKLLVDRAEVAATHRDDPAGGLVYLIDADEAAGPGAGPDHLLTGLELFLRFDVSRVEAARRLQRRYKARKSWPRLVNVLMLEQRAATEPAARVALTLRAAEVAELKLEDPAAALRVVVTAFKANPEAAELRGEAVRLAKATADWGSLLHVAREALEGTDDGELVRDLGLWLGPVEHHEVGDLAGAVHTYEAVLAVDPHEATATAALDELYEATADHRGRRRLIERQIAATPVGPEREALELGLAALVAEWEGGLEAVPILRRVLEANPRSERAREALHALAADDEAGAAAAEVLEPMYRAAEAWPRLVELLETRAKASESPAERAALWRSAAVIHEEWLGDKIAALKHFSKAVLATPDDRLGLRQLERLGSNIGAWDELVRVFGEVAPRIQDATMRRDALLTVARVQETKLGDLEAALGRYQAVLALEPEHAEALQATRRLHSQRGDLKSLVAVTEAQAAAEAVPAVALEMWSDVYEAAFARGDEDTMMLACMRALAVEPNDRAAAERLVPIYEARGLVAELGGLLAQLASQESDPVAEAALKVRLGRLREEELGDRVGATEAYEEAWELDPTRLDAWERLRAIFREDGRWNNLVALLRGQVTRAAAVAERTALRLEVAAVAWERLRNADEAIRTYQAVLEEEPGALEAYDALVQLYASQRRFEELAGVLERKAAAQGGTAAGRDTLVRAAVVRLDQLEELDLAEAALDRVLAEDRGHTEAMLAKARLLTRRGEPAEAAALLAALLKDLKGTRRVPTLLELTRVVSEQLGDAARALPYALEARRIQPESAAVHRLLRPLLERTGGWGELQGLLEEDFEAAKDDGERTRRALALARLHHEHTRDEAALGEWLGRAEALSPESVEVAELVVERLREAEDWEGLGAKLVSLLVGLEKQHRRDQVPVRAHQLAQVHERLGREEEAAEAYQAAMEADGTYTPNLVDYGRLLVRRGAWETALMVHQSLLMQFDKIEDEAVKGDVLYHLALASAELGQKPRALQYLRRLERQAPKHEGVAALKARLSS